MCSGIPLQTLLRLAVTSCGPLIRVPTKRSRDARETIARPLRHLPPGKAMRAGISKRNWLLFWCLIRHEAQRRVSANALPGCRKERAATVEVLVLVCSKQGAAAAGFVHR